MMGRLRPARQEKGTRQLEHNLAALRARQERTEAKVAIRRAKIATETTRRSAAEQEHRRLSFEIAETQNRIFVRSALTRDLLRARSAFIAKLRRAQSDSITVSELRSLETEIETDQEALQETCTHPFVFSYDGYGGSYSYDYDDAYRGHRICALCNLRESSEGTNENIYKILPDDDGTHFVCRDLRHKDELPSGGEEEWFTVEFLKQLFEASARSHNVEWPSVIDKKSVLKI